MLFFHFISVSKVAKKITNSDDDNLCFWKRTVENKTFYYDSTVDKNFESPLWSLDFFSSFAFNNSASYLQSLYFEEGYIYKQAFRTKLINDANPIN